MGSLLKHYIAYGNAEPNIYFATEQFEEAKSHYSDSAQFNFFCLLGNIYDANERIGLESVDSSMFDALIAFSKENEYKPFAFVKNEEDLKIVNINL